MDDRFDREDLFSNTQSGRGRSYDTDEPTKYPTRRERPPLRSTRREDAEGHEPEKEGFFGETRMAQPRRTAERQEQYLPYEWEKKAFSEHGSAAEERAAQSHAASHSHSQNRSHSHRSSQNSARQRHKKKRKKRRMSGFAKILIVLLIAIAVGICCFKLMSGMMNPPEEELKLTGQTVTVTIPEGSGTEDIANILKENKLIGSVFGFKLTSKLDGYDGTYKQGTYEIDTGLTKRQIMELLQSGTVAQQITLTIPEGYNVRQIAEKAAETGLCTAEEFIQESNADSFDYDFLKDLPEREYRLEGYLFPDTYFLSESMTAHDIVDMLLSRFDRMYTAEYRKAVEESGYTLDEIVTIASMVEKEIKVAEERPRAAGVIYNRLRDGIMLGIDATVLYAVDKTAGELTQEDLNVDSPYNTRNRYGLPLGPICNPGESAFEAALYPETHEYLYYVLEAVGKDNHIYCKTYDEFLTAKQAYQASAQ